MLYIEHLSIPVTFYKIAIQAAILLYVFRINAAFRVNMANHCFYIPLETNKDVRMKMGILTDFDKCKG